MKRLFRYAPKKMNPENPTIRLHGSLRGAIRERMYSAARLRICKEGYRCSRLP